MTCRSQPGVTVEPGVLLWNVNNVTEYHRQARHPGAVMAPLHVHGHGWNTHDQATESKQPATLGDGGCFVNPRFSFRPVVSPPG